MGLEAINKSYHYKLMVALFFFKKVKDKVAHFRSLGKYSVGGIDNG